MKKLYGIIEDGEVLTAYTSLVEVNGREYMELIENFTWEQSDYTDPVTEINYITPSKLAAAFNALCAQSGMKKKVLAQICGKDATTFSRYCSGLTPVPRLIWEKVEEYSRH